MKIGYLISTLSFEFVILVIGNYLLFEICYLEFYD